MKRNIFLIITLLQTFTIVFGQSQDSRLIDLGLEIETWMEKYNAVGVSISIVENNEIIFNKGYGFRDLEKKKPITVNTVFPIASCTKAFTATLLGILEKENKLTLTDKPSTHIPSLQFNTLEMNNSIIIKDLLSHKSGLGAINGTLVLFPENNRLKIMEKLRYIRPEGKVKESSIYSNMGYTILGTISEAVTNESWERNIKHRIFEKLEMNSSFTNLEDAIETDDFSFGYGLYQNEIKKVNFEQYYDYKPAGGIRSTSKDLSNWMLAWLNNGKFENEQVIPESYVKYARKLHNLRNNNDEPDLFLQGYGLGWRVEARNGEFRVYHGGNTSGFSSVVIIYPYKGFGITVLVNQDDSILPYIIADIVQNRMLEMERVDDYPIIVKDIYQPSVYNELTNSKKPPSDSLTSFIGDYKHNGYGTIKIVLENEKLYAIFPTYKFFLEHLHYDIFVMKPTEDITDVFNPEFGLNFKKDGNGEISSFSINLQSEPIEFVKIR